MLLDKARDFIQFVTTETPEDDQPVDDVQMTIFEHLEELRRRLMICLIALGVATGASFLFTKQVFDLLKRPAPPNFQPVFIEMTEMFVTYFKVALLTGVTLAMPVIVYQAFRFVAPALTRREKRYLLIVSPFVALFFALGILFGYFVTLPFAITYLLTFGTDVATPAIKIGNYISFVTTILFWMGLSFELPVVIWFLARLRVVRAEQLVRVRKYVILVIFIIAAIITPTPDPLNQTLIAVPLWLLYELGVLLARLA
jgi:sec-independent protein translocase protein TatC